MSKIQIRIPAQQPELETAITAFIREAFNQHATFTKEPSSDSTHKGVIVDFIWQGITIVATLEGAFQLAERAKRIERVQKLLDVIKKSGQAVYLKINNDKTVDLSKKTAEETMTLLEKKEHDDKK